MAADLHIHVYVDITEKDMKAFFSNNIGSKWCPITAILEEAESMSDEECAKRFNATLKENSKLDWEVACDKIAGTPGIWIGEVSWLKAALFEDDDAFIPDPVGTISELIGEDLPVLDDELIEKIMAALELTNTTGYEIVKPGPAKEFLEKYKGQQVFTVS